MEHVKETELTASEISSLWTSYMNGALSICILKYFLNTVQDEEIKPVIEYALEVANGYTEDIKKVFEKEDFPIPQGFTDNDVNMNAPRLVTDIFMLHFVKSIAKIGLSTFSLARCLSTRQDVRSVFKYCIDTTQELDDKALQVALNKGILIRPPYLPVPEKVSFVEGTNFMSGFFGERRPLTSIEITSIFTNLDTNLLGSNLMTAFSQTAQSQDVKTILWRGKKIADKHAKAFAQKLQEDNLPAPSLWDVSVTASQEAPFSDKLMLYLTTMLNAAGIGNYGLAAASSMRHDLSFMYARFIAEIGAFAEDAADLLIESGWMEEPPQSLNRNELIKKNP
ncbi:DUF3231 family protein [Ammoniphilus sp. 3BR4]|uniref:DUF3231 family protein n=1 Tax=Ammoniphilus sp. 3BR4 TaxID=3158265 RepID=UPI0034658EA9